MVDIKTSRRDFIKKLMISSVSIVYPYQISCGKQSNSHPNILFLLADDQRADTIAAYGNPNIKTPNLDKLVAEGFSFRRNYCLGAPGGAVCVPSRAMIHTGFPYFKIDMKMKGVKTLGEYLQEIGYKTFATGKWHNGEESFLRSFEEGKAIYFGGMADHTKVPVVDTTPDKKIINKRTAEKFSSECFTDAVINFLDDYQENQPFFAYVAFTAPHDPRNPPEKYRDMYYTNPPPLPKNFKSQHPFDNGHMIGRDENLAAWPRDKKVVQEQLCEYYGLITHLDEHIGRILYKLENSKFAKNTIVIYAADHGLAMGSHGLLGKQSVYEHSMGCPLIFSGSGIPKNQSSEAFTYLLDIFATICHLTGVTTPPEIEGKNLQPIWEGKQSTVRETLFLSFKKVQRAIRDDKWKLIRYPEINFSQLFDLKNDPDELYNLAEKTEFQGKIKDLSAKLKEWQSKIGDDLSLTVKNPKPMEIDLSGHERKPDKWQPEWIRKKYF
jgi:arylsulfatase A-like enzyme